VTIRRAATAAASVVAVLLCALAATGAGPAPAGAPAAGRPDFTGTWVLDTARTEFGRIPGARWRSRVDVIEHREPRIRQTLHLDTGGSRDTAVYVYSTTGAPTVNRVAGADITSTVEWTGTDLRLLSKARLLLVVEMKLDETWHLSPDGRTLTMTRQVKHPLGEGSQTLVFAKR
jgi:hypothetical protein